MNRRTVLAGIAAGAASLAGCLGGPPTGGTDTGGTDTGTAPDTTDGEPGLPVDCPTTQGFDVEWPTDLDAGTVESFVEAYEHVYYREAVAEYEPESSLDAYELAGSVSDSPEESGDGWELAYSGSGGIYRPTLSLEATTAVAPDGAEVVPVVEIDEASVVELLRTAAEEGEASHHVEPPGEAVDRHVELFSSLSDGFELSGPGDSDTLYIDVEGTTVELAVTATNFHGDYWWEARYYVSEQVVRRTAEEGTDPRDGTLLECRHLE